MQLPAKTAEITYIEADKQRRRYRLKIWRFQSMKNVRIGLLKGKRSRIDKC